jgi:hypothetical protein
MIPKCFGKKLENVGPPPFSPFNGGEYNLIKIINDPTVKNKRLRILYNPSSGNGNCLKIIKQVEKQLINLKADYELIRSKSLEHFN